MFVLNNWAQVFHDLVGGGGSKGGGGGHIVFGVLQFSCIMPFGEETVNWCEGHLADMSVSGCEMWYDMKIAKHNLFIIHFCFGQVYLFDIVCGVKGKTAECSECGDMGFLPAQKKPYHPCDMCFLPTQKSRITHVTHYHTFCTPQEWHMLESHVSITYAKMNIFSGKCMININKHMLQISTRFSLQLIF